MLQCKRFRLEDEFNEWARKENIQSYHVMAIVPAPSDSMMIFYDENRKKSIDRDATTSYYDNKKSIDFTSISTSYHNDNNSIIIDGNRINMIR